LLVAPLFILIGVFRKSERSFPFMLAALILMALGTAGTFLAVASGDAAGELAEKIPGVTAVLEQHEELAETTEVIFAALTAIFAAILFVPRLLKAQPTRALSTVLPLVFLLFYGTGAITLANTAHQGGRLVHELGGRAPIQPGPATIQSAERDRD